MSAVRWNVAVSPETDRSVRMLIAEQGGRKGDLSRFIEDAVRDAIFRETAAAAKAANAGVPREEIEAIVDEAVQWARTQ